MLRRLALAGLAVALAAPALTASPASGAVLFSCSGASATATITPGLSHNQTAQTVSATGALSGCGTGGGGSATLTAGAPNLLNSYPSRPLGCPTTLGGAGPDYPDQTPVLLGADPSFDIDWAAGADSTGVAKAKAGPAGSGTLRIVFNITAGQYMPPAGQKTKLKGALALNGVIPTNDTFTCADDSDPASSVNFVNSGSLIVTQK
jgi:hypothetical protein